jgi:uncharacterized protein YdhG (YjbR/CyaY superfamily)
MTIHIAATTAEEVISYNMPAFKQNGILVWFAGYKNHIGFYPSSTPIKLFKEQLTKYKTSKGAIQFPIDKPLPLALITKIVKFRIKQNSEKAAAKQKKGGNKYFWYSIKKLLISGSRAFNILNTNVNSLLSLQQEAP